MIWSNVIIHIIDCSFDFDTKVSLNLDLISYLDLILVTDLVVYIYLLNVLDPIENLDLFNNLDIVDALDVINDLDLLHLDLDLFLVDLDIFDTWVSRGGAGGCSGPPPWNLNFPLYVLVSA